MGAAALFKVLWSSGDESWITYPNITELESMKTYLEVMGVENIFVLTHGIVAPPNDPQVFVGSLEVGRGTYIRSHRSSPFPSPKTRQCPHFTTRQCTFSFHCHFNPTHPFSACACGMTVSGIADFMLNSGVCRLQDHSIILTESGEDRKSYRYPSALL